MQKRACKKATFSETRLCISEIPTNPGSPWDPQEVTVSCSKPFNTSQLGLAPCTAQLHQTCEELQKSCHLAPQENMLWGLEENSWTSDSWQVFPPHPQFLFSFSFPQVISITQRSHTVQTSPCQGVTSLPGSRSAALAEGRVSGYQFSSANAHL